MYQIKRNHILEQVQFEDNGKTLDLTVDLNVDTILRQYIAAQYNISAAAQVAKQVSDAADLAKCEEAMGTAVMGLLTVVFGEKQTEQICDFYENNALEMLSDIVPFINDVVAPKVAEAQQRIEDRYKQVSKRGR